ncbi:MAG: hypothetical protein GW903_06350 [Alphaproteobacteria bacterium]|nr:hypothetical protein [Alphaproteobacteria bacterium]NCQ88502.1 hypothetical protein [Alphaproteobacteria bacterium]NCT06045.1 hypothetical protein [Alphaproteobacteria bacterium]
MIHSLFGPTLNSIFLSLRLKISLFDAAPAVIWLGCMIMGLIGVVFIGFMPPIIAVFLILVTFTASFAAGANDIESAPVNIPHMIMRQTVMAAFIFMMSIGQETAGSFILLTYVGLFASAWGINSIRMTHTDFSKGRAFYHPSHLIGEYEIILFMILIGLVSTEAFSAIATLFGIACWVTIASRFYDIFKNID